MDNNSFKNALTELEALKTKALGVQAEIDASKKDSLSLAETLAQQEAQTVVSYASQAADAKISAIKNVDSHSENRAKKFIKDWSDAFSQAKTLAEKFSSQTGGIFSITGSGTSGEMPSGGLGQLISAATKVFGLPDIFGGYFAEGGRPDTGKVSLVGERGPELFVPDSAGTVIPNENLQSTTPVVVYQNFTFQSLDPATNMRLLQAQKEQIQSWVADGIKNNAQGLRSAVKSSM